MLWLILFSIFIALILLDLGVIHRQVREISLYEALAMSAFWISIGLGFAVLIYFIYAHQWFVSSELGGRQALFEYLTAFSLEKMLSLDNLFVIALIFHQLRVPVPQQYRVLFWGILIAIILRGLFILGGMYLINSFDWMVYVFGGILLFSAMKVFTSQAGDNTVQENLLVRAIRKLVPVETEISDNQFIRRIDQRVVLTPLFIALVMVESADMMFAMDSIPAVIAVSRDPFIVYSSNVFAVLGLRALYFVLASALQQFHYLKFSMVIILGFIGIKMLLSHTYPISALTSLLVIIVTMLLGIIASLLDKSHGKVLATSPVVEELGRFYAMTFAGIKRIAILLLGTSVVIVGIVMIFTPGPAIVVIPAGLAILGTEFVWARRILKYFKTKLVHYQRETRNYLRRKKPYRSEDTNKDST
ncbi:MAG: TerC/Alx family metal homeostasis membrane protein [Gammaproteobacteria bacterium]